MTLHEATRLTILSFDVILFPFSSSLTTVKSLYTMDQDQAMADTYSQSTDPRIVILQEEIADLRLQLG